MNRLCMATRTIARLAGLRGVVLIALLILGVHVCRGNYKGMYLSEGGYDSVGERFFGRTRVNHFLLEFDTPRAGGFDPGSQLLGDHRLTLDRAPHRLAPESTLA